MLIWLSYPLTCSVVAVGEILKHAYSLFVHCRFGNISSLWFHLPYPKLTSSTLLDVCPSDSDLPSCPTRGYHEKSAQHIAVDMWCLMSPRDGLSTLFRSQRKVGISVVVDLRSPGDVGFRFRDCSSCLPTNAHANARH
jgi:hypothetical protein